MKKMYSEDEIRQVSRLYRHNITFSGDKYAAGVHGSVICSTSKPFETAMDIYTACQDVTIPVVCYSTDGTLPTINAVAVESDGSIRVNSGGVPPSSLQYTSISDAVFPV